MKDWKRRLGILFCALALTLPMGAVWAQDAPETAEQPPAAEEQKDPEALTGRQARRLIEAVVNHLAIYGRYEDITPENLYHAALNQLVDQDPALYETALKTMLEGIDEHSEYYTAEEAKDLMQTVNGEVYGIGVTLDFTNPDAAVVGSVIPDTPAAKAGLQVGDTLVSADGENLRGLKSESILDKVRGIVGTAIHLEVEREGRVLGFDMVREAIVGTSVVPHIYETPEGKLMYIRIYGFVVNTAEKLKEALDQAAEAGITNLILDLRDNGGGILEQAVAMADYFVPKDSIITTEDHKVTLLNRVYKGTLDQHPDYDTVILINKNSASAAEVFSAALRENDAAILIGTDSYGKGTIQSISSLETGGMIKYTSGYYLTPQGNNINGVGLSPDSWVENSTIPINPEDYGHFAYNRVYQVGDTGEEVRLAKKILTLFGLYTGQINDVYDQELYYAVYALQNQVRVYPYGVLDLTTQLQLQNLLARTKLQVDDQLRAGFAHFGMSYPQELVERTGLE